MSHMSSFSSDNVQPPSITDHAPSSIFFYSPKCKYCVQCLQLLEPYSSYAQFIGYVDIHKSRQHLPLRIRRVPTLVINGGEHVYEGKEVFKWIHEFIQMVENNNSKHKTNTETTSSSLYSSETLKNHDDDHNTKNITVLSSTSSLIQNDATDTAFFSSISNTRTLSDSIDYTKVKPVEPEQTKTVMSPDTLLSQRNLELEKILPHPGNRMSTR